MKKIKEFIKKIGNKKYCLLSLLLASLLLFAFISGLNGSKSAVTEVNALSAPQEKNLDLNGIRYSYQTSYNELRSSYNLFSHWAYPSFFIRENSEGEVNLKTSYMQLGTEYSDSQWDDLNNIIKNSFTLEYDDYLVGAVISNNNERNINQTVFTFDESPTITNITGIKINYDFIKKIPTVNSDLFATNSYITAVYVSDDNINDLIYHTFANTLYKSEVYYKFKKIQGYSVRAIFSNYNSYNDEANSRCELVFDIPVNIFTAESFDSITNTTNFAIIDNLDFSQIENNVISFDTYFNETKPYKGNILLSETNNDDEFINKLISSSGNKIQKFNGGAVFGGDFNNNKLINSFYYLNQLGAVVADVDGEQGLFNNNGELFRFNSPATSNKITYLEQNRLIYLPNFNDLKINIDNRDYSGLSSQVEDILYTVNYVGDVEQIEFNEKVEEDFQNLIKTTGLGAFIGLLIGLIFGNPLLGAAIGAGWGLIAGIFPLLIDGLQAIFGKNFLSGLYNLFKSITEFFANFVDTIINFLLSIITNPVTLILIVIGAILYIIYYFQKK